MEYLKQFGLIYLASPYSQHPEGHEKAYQDVSALAGRLAAGGVKVFCPIAHSHPLAVFAKLDNVDAEFWLKLDHAVMRHCEALVLADMPGLMKSYGVSREIGFFWGAGRPVFKINPATLDITPGPASA